MELNSSKGKQREPAGWMLLRYSGVLAVAALFLVLRRIPPGLQDAAFLSVLTLSGVGILASCRSTCSNRSAVMSTLANCIAAFMVVFVWLFGRASL
ncbi:MAG TPA: hypothetical protein PKA27_12430 [Fimbriimonadaceae bacterium]|nr:hypothetical protein [Fimbriimonadaceae bacterium]